MCMCVIVDWISVNFDTVCWFNFVLFCFLDMRRQARGQKAKWRNSRYKKNGDGKSVIECDNSFSHHSCVCPTLAVCMCASCRKYTWVDSFSCPLPTTAVVAAENWFKCLSHKRLSVRHSVSLSLSAATDIISSLYIGIHYNIHIQYPHSACVYRLAVFERQQIIRWIVSCIISCSLP